MNQIFMSNLKHLIDTIFPPAMRNACMSLIRELWYYINLMQLHIYFMLDEIPYLRGLCPVLEGIDKVIRFFCRLMIYILKIELWFLVTLGKVYVKVLRYATILFFGYSVLVAISNMGGATNDSMLEVILQNTEWIYQYAGQFIDFNVAIAKKLIENFCAVPFEQRPIFEQRIITDVNQLVDWVKQFIGK